MSELVKIVVGPDVDSCSCEDGLEIIDQKTITVIHLGLNSATKSLFDQLLLIYHGAREITK